MNQMGFIKENIEESESILELQNCMTIRKVALLLGFTVYESQLVFQVINQKT